MGRRSGSVTTLARHAGTTATGGGLGLLGGYTLAHSGTAAIVAAVCLGIGVHLPKIVESICKHLPAAIEKKGEADAKRIKANAEKAEAEVKKIHAVSEARNSAKQTDAQVHLMRKAMKSGKVKDATSLLKQQKLLMSPKARNADMEPGGGAANVRPIRRPPRRSRGEDGTTGAKPSALELDSADDRVSYRPHKLGRLEPYGLFGR
jgi:hypothetical protein